jgi:pimeloyl-ACP methyl ester carboxylesterase
MTEFEEVMVKLQSGVDVRVTAWAGHDDAQPMVIVSKDYSAGDWTEFVSFLSSSHAPVVAEISSAYELILLIWEIGEPVVLLSQGSEAADWVSQAVVSAPGAVASLVVCDGEIASGTIKEMHSLPTLILRGRQSSLLSHEAAVALHHAVAQSTLIEPENCGEFPAKDNPDAAASAANWFLTGSGKGADDLSSYEPVDPRA